MTIYSKHLRRLGIALIVTLIFRLLLYYVVRPLFHLKGLSVPPLWIECEGAIISLISAAIAIVDSKRQNLVKYTITASFLLVIAMVLLLLQEGQGVDALINLSLLFMGLILFVQFGIRKRVRMMEFINRRKGNTLDLRIKSQEDLFNPLFMGPHIEPNHDIIDAIDTYVGTLTVSAPLTICFHCPQAISPVIQDTLIESIGLHYQDQLRQVERFMENRFIRYIVLIIFSITALRVMTLLPDKAEQTILWVVFSNFAAFSLWQIGSTYYERAEAFEKLTQLTIIKESKMVFLCREG